MAMTSIEYKELLNRFEEDLQEIIDSLYQVTQPKTPPKKREEVMNTARRKLKDYDALLAQLDGARRTRVETDFADWMDQMRQYLTQLEKGR